MWWRDRETEAVDTNGRTFWNDINMKSKLVKDRVKKAKGRDCDHILRFYD